ncbi:MAG TPA: hypothetical protein VHM20_00380 [Gammaproteobacteria bacterium]|jgi:hypothetical protein|nr:hypothetical protein [Gammaproteobacteria bacterium]
MRSQWDELMDLSGLNHDVNLNQPLDRPENDPTQVHFNLINEIDQQAEDNPLHDEDNNLQDDDDDQALNLPPLPLLIARPLLKRKISLIYTNPITNEETQDDPSLNNYEEIKGHENQFMQALNNTGYQHALKHFIKLSSSPEERYTEGACAGLLNTPPTLNPPLGQNRTTLPLDLGRKIGFFLQRKEGGIVAASNKAAADQASEDRDFKPSQTR